MRKNSGVNINYNVDMVSCLSAPIICLRSCSPVGLPPMSSCCNLPVIVKDPTLDPSYSVRNCIWSKKCVSFRSFTTAIFCSSPLQSCPKVTTVTQIVSSTPALCLDLWLCMHYTSSVFIIAMNFVFGHLFRCVPSL